MNDIAQIPLLALALLGAPSVRGESELRLVERPVYRPAQVVTLDIGEMIAAGMVEPKTAISIDVAKPMCWLLRTPKSAKGFQWYRNLLNMRPGAPDLTIDPKLRGVYDIYAQVRAVHAGDALGVDAKPDDLSAMAFVIELDDGSKREVVAAKGFPEYHFDTEVLAGCRWNLDGREIILRSLDKPVYLYALRFVPAKMARTEVAGETVQRNFSVIAGKPATLQANAVWRSKDKGLSWEEVGIATYTLYKPGSYDYVWYDEPFLCVVPGKCWTMASRVDLDGYARIVRSTDRGKTWGEVTKTPVWGYPQHLLPLRDGRLLTTYGYRRPPFGVRACLSNDNGKTWDIENEIIIRMDAGPSEEEESRVGASDLGYPMSKQLDDGRIFSVYYFNKGQSNCYVAGTFWALPSN